MEIADFDFVVDVIVRHQKPTKAVWPIMKEQGMAALWLPLHHLAFTEISASQTGAVKLGVVGFINTPNLKARKTISTSTRWPRCLDAYDLKSHAAGNGRSAGPEQVTPAVVFMCSSRPLPAKLFAPGQALCAAAQIVETRGMYLGTPADGRRCCQKIGSKSQNSTIRLKPCSRAANKHAVSSN